MKLFGALMLISVLSAGQIYSQSVGLGNTDPKIFTKFRIPSTQMRRFDISGNTNFTTGRQSIPQQTINQQTFSLGISPDYFYLDESDNRALSFNARLSGGIDEYKTERNFASPNTITSNSSNKSFNLLLRPSLSVYTSPEKSLFYRLNADLQVNMYESFGKEKNPPQPERFNVYGNKNQRYSVSAGIGWGRLRDVTSVVNAIRFQERLKVLNKINADLSEDDILAISSQFARFSIYTENFERPGKYFYRDLNDILAQRNINLNDLNLYAASYLMETLQELKFQRIEGFETGLNVMMNYINNYDMNEYQPNPRSSQLTETLQAALKLYAGYSHQLDLYSQFSLYMSISGGPNVIAHPEPRQIYNFSLNPVYSRELTDRFLFTASDNASYTIQNTFAEKSGFSNDLSLSFNYFVEDNISLNARYSWFFTENKYKTTTPQQDLNFFNNLTSTHSVWMGITYILQNSLNIF
ncbi:MAG: hypothetical protein ACM3Q2_18040 [Syntrophothermus sp.]